jgi:SagB-type dehydrogenase family enzyme
MAVTWSAYHEVTKHKLGSVSRAPHHLDWANMPNPFRHYEGVPLLDLSADPPAPETPALEVLRDVSGLTPAHEGASFLSQLLLHSAAISASKRVASTGYRYALRVNPSSGNLHPTEFHFRTRGVKDWPDGLYHYRPSAHMAEQRALGDVEIILCGSSAPLVFVLTSVTWRESWKYGDRAYRYCLHDIGHAWQALALAARAMGCDSFAVGDFPDNEVAERCRLPDDEAPMLLVELRGESIPAGESNVCETVWYGGYANQLSAETSACLVAAGS